MEEIQELVKLTGNSTNDYKLINLKLTKLLSEKIQQIEETFQGTNKKIKQNKEMEDFLLQLNYKYNFKFGENEREKENSVLTINEKENFEKAQVEPEKTEKDEFDQAKAEKLGNLNKENTFLKKLLDLNSGLTVSDFGSIKSVKGQTNEELDHAQVIEVRFSNQFKKEMHAEFESTFLIVCHERLIGRKPKHKERNFKD